ncbi:MAG TPA: DUF4129 domain-containing protein [Candidatus Dormibacteraeota bacterium]
MAGVVLLLPLVALASRPESGSGGPLLSADPTRVLLDVAIYLFVALVLVSLLVVAWALWPRPGEEIRLPPRRRRPLATALTTLATTLLAVLVALALRGRRGGLPLVGSPGGAGGRLAPNLAAPARPAPPAGVDWVAAAIVAVLLIAAGVALWWALRPRPSRARALPVARLRAVLDDAIEDVLGEIDPRRAVLRAWTRLERVLARHGLPRRDSEAPFEYAARAGAELGVEAAWLERLAGLFEWARFSLHDVTPAMRDEALGGLVAVRDGLRLAT